MDRSDDTPPPSLPSPPDDSPTLRDRFACAALTGILASEASDEGGALYVNEHGEPLTNRYSPHHYAALAYKLADAMLAARGK